MDRDTESIALNEAQLKRTPSRHLEVGSNPTLQDAPLYSMRPTLSGGRAQKVQSQNFATGWVRFLS